MSIKSNPWPWFIGGLLMTVVIANAIMLTIATGTPPILEDEDAYESSLTYDQVIAAREAARALNWRAEVQQIDGRLEWRMLDAQAQPVRGLAGQLMLRRADTQQHDRTLTLAEAKPGVYRAEWAGQPGAYRVDIQLERGAERWVATREMRLR
jgi:nitrogen fixation protein FixH